MSDSKPRVTTFEDNTQHTGGGGASAPSRFEEPLDCPTGDPTGQVIAPGRADPAWDSKEDIQRQRQRRGGKAAEAPADDSVSSDDPLGDVKREHPEAYDEFNTGVQDHIRTQKDTAPRVLTRAEPVPRRRKTDK